MNVREFIAKLQQYDPEALVVLSRDPEGNGYSPRYELRAGIYADGEYFNAEHELDRDRSARHGAQRCVALWPEW